MKRLHRLIIMSFIGPFVMTFFIVLFLLLMQFLWRYIDELVGKGLDVSIIGELLLYASAGLVPLALPLAILLSSLMAFGNMGEFYELTAIKASGISLRRIMQPIIFLVIIITIGSFLFSNNVLPVTNLKMKSLISDVRRQRPEVSIIEGAFYNGLGDYSIRVNKKDPVTNMLYGLQIYDHSAGKGNIIVTIADSGRMKMTADKRNMIIVLWDGHRYEEVIENKRRRERRFPHQTLKFKEQQIIIELSGFELSRSDASIFKNAYQMLNVQQLQRAVDSIKRDLNSKTRTFHVSMVNKSLLRTNSKFPNYKNFGDSEGIEEDNLPPEITYGEQANSVTSTTSVSPEREPMNAAERRARARRMALMKRADLERSGQKSITDSGKQRIAQPVPANLKKITDFDTLVASINARDRLELIKSAKGNISQSHFQIASATTTNDIETRLLRRHEIELHRKFTLSMACLIFLFIGAPLGAIIRKGGLGLPTVISTLLFILYYIISLTGEKFVRESILSAYQGMWLSSFILVIAGIFLTYQATNDAAILNVDTYMNWIREKIGVRKGIMLEKKLHIAGRFELIEIQKDELQDEFRNLGASASDCLKSLKEENKWPILIRKSFENSAFIYLIEFGIHYNSFLDRIILSKWFRIPYFKKRLSEFPLVYGRTRSNIFTNKTLIWLAVILFPVALIRLIHIKLKVRRVSRQLKQIADLSSGMVNLLNSAAFKSEIEKEI
ncbi:MAG: LptF/LptG family permease [Bacteroidales bacterium]